MRDPARIPHILEYIRVLWELHPDQRLGQLLVNAAPDFEDRVYFYEDDELARNLRKTLQGE